MQLGNLKTPPSRDEYTNYGIGTASALIFVSLLGEFGIWDVPAETAVAFGGFFTWLAWRLKLGNA